MQTQPKGVTNKFLQILSVAGGIQSCERSDFGMANPLMGLLVLLVVPVVDCFACPSHCFCYTWNGLARTDCVRRNLFNTFVGFSSRTQVLDLSYNVITILHGNEFLDSNLRLLRDIRLSNNELHQIDKLSFNGLELLENLDLSHNSIECLHPDTFNRNPNLRTLNVSFNPLSLKNDGPFLSSGESLQVLDMADCRLEFLTSDSFSDLKRLRFLNVSRNNIRKIDLGFMEGMKSLKYLDVSKNEFPCNDDADTLIRSLVSRRIQFQTFCERNQKAMMIPIVETLESDQSEAEERVRDRGENITAETPQDGNTAFNDVILFFRSISSFYAAICGVQIGVLIGSFLTYFCMRRAVRKRKTRVDSAGRRPTCLNDNFALISLTTPPGTPPSPYHSRFFSVSVG